MRALVEFDGSTKSHLALETARALSWPPGSGAEILSVLPTDIELFGGPWPAVTYVQPTDVRDRLRDERRHLGTRGHGLLKRLILGSTARTVLHHAPMSVLIVRPSA